MKILQEVKLIDSGSFGNTREYRETMNEIRLAIRRIVNPPNGSIFTLHPKGKGNGVVPIKSFFQNNIYASGWSIEQGLKLAASERPGPVDATKLLKDKSSVFGVEWETGNISSSHRSLNRLSLGLIEGILKGGALILPSRKMYRYLTDRVGNFKELEPYFPIWRNLQIENGVLVVIEIEHDALSTEVATIPKGVDGNSFRVKQRSPRK